MILHTDGSEDSFLATRGSHFAFFGALRRECNAVALVNGIILLMNQCVCCNKLDRRKFPSYSVPFLFKASGMLGFRES